MCCGLHVWPAICTVQKAVTIKCCMLHDGACHTRCVLHVDDEVVVVFCTADVGRSIRL